MFQSLLIPIDLGASSERVLTRASLLPLAKDARLTLMHVVPRLPREATARVKNDAHEALAHAAQKLAGKLGKRRAIEQTVKVGSAAAEIAREAARVRADLIVMGRGVGRGVTDLFLGSTAERVIRAEHRPVLVVRLAARGPYRRPLAAVDIDEPSDEILDVARRLLPPPRPPITVVHAHESPFHGLIYPSLSQAEVEEYRRRYRERAHKRIADFVAAATDASELTEPVAWEPYVRQGSPRTVVPKAVTKLHGDLLVVGTRGHTGLAHAFLGTVAGDVLREVACDVLVVPPRPAQPGAA